MSSSNIFSAHVNEERHSTSRINAMHVAHVSPKRRRTTVHSPTLALDVKCKPGHPNRAYMSEITRRCACTKWCDLERIPSSTTHMQVPRDNNSIQKVLPARAHAHGNQADSQKQSIANPKHVLRRFGDITCKPAKRNPETRNRTRKRSAERPHRLQNTPQLSQTAKSITPGVS